MQNYAVPPTSMRPTGSYPSETMSSAVRAVTEPRSPSPDSSTVKLSHEAKDRYVTEQHKEQVHKDASGHPGQQARDNENSNADSVTEALMLLQEALRDVQYRLHVAQEQMAQTMNELKSAGDGAEKMLATVKLQTAQVLVISIQNELLEIHNRINRMLTEEAQLKRP